MPSAPYVRWFKDIGLDDVGLVGGKTASLGELYSALSPQGISVPNGFAVTAAAYRGALLETDAPLDLGTSIALTLQLPGSGADVKCVARVVREAGGNDGRFWSGVEFLILREDGREQLQRFIGDVGQH